jgi:putative tricarboxylic transport membrane protein
MRWGRVAQVTEVVPAGPVGELMTGSPRGLDGDRQRSTRSALAADAAPQPDSATADVEARPAGSWAYIVAAAGPAVLAVFIMLQSLNLGLGSLSSPRPGLWPFAVSVALLGTTVVLLLGWSRFGDCDAWGTGAARAAVGAASLVPFVLLTPQIGFEIPAFLLLVFWMKVLGGESWRISLAVGLGAVVAVHLTFIEALGVSLPYLFGF